MSRHQGRRSPFWYLRRGRRALESDLDEELKLHIDLRIEELRASGLSAEDARREALRQFGDLEYTRRYCHEQDREKEKQMARGLLFEELFQDLKISLRGLVRAPIMTLTIVATVGLGIGATTVIFSAIDAALLRSLPYADSGRIVRIYTDSPPNKFPFSVADYLALNAQQTRFEKIAGYASRSMAFTDGATAERVRGRLVSWTYFSLLGLRPAAGRDFVESEGRPGGPRSVILSDGFWRQRLGGRPDAVGRAVRLDGEDYTVVGILPPVVGPLEQGQDFFIAAQWTTPPRKGPFFITALGRVRPGSDRAAADELHAINRSIFPVWRVSYQDDRATWGMMDLKAHVVGDVRATAGLALGAVALVWLIACANASSLLIARVTSRRRELAVRAALGASRARVLRYLLAESSLLAVGAAAIGTALAWTGIRLLREAGGAFFPRTQEIAFAGPALWILAGLTAASTLLFGLVPALHGSGGPVEASLRSSGRSSTGSVSVRRVRRILVATQFAIATPLLIVAGLLLVSLNELGRVDLGFNTHNLLTATILLPAAQYPNDRVGAFWDELQRRAQSIPGVAGMTYSDSRPPSDVNNFNNFDLLEAPTPPGESQPVTPWITVAPDYFQLVGLNLLQGRLLDVRDGLRPNLESVVVDRAWARRFFPDGTALGKRLRSGGCSVCPAATVVGIVSDVKYVGVDKPDEGTVYAPMPPQQRSRYVMLRTNGDAAAVVAPFRQVVRELDAGLPLASVATIDELVSQSLQRPRSLSILVGGFAIVALVLSMIGIYGVMAYYVQQHAKDISIRLALGGTPHDVLRLIVGQGMGIVSIGLAIGLAAAVGLTRLVASLLFGVGALDPRAFGGVTALLLTIALVACLVPARRVTALEPAAMLRQE